MQLRELNSIVDHMHAREDLYRRAIRELQDELDAKDSDRKRALKKLKSTKEEISQLTDRLSTLQQEYHSSAAVAAASRGQGGGAAPSGSMHGARLAVHGTFVIVVASVWWFCQKEHPALAWKLVFSMFFPVSVAASGLPPGAPWKSHYPI